jgi:hypothetical protein
VNGAGSPGGLGGVAACPRAGCSAPRVLVAGQVAAGPIAVDSTRVYWSAYNAANQITVWTIPKP